MNINQPTTKVARKLGSSLEGHSSLTARK